MPVTAEGYVSPDGAYFHVYDGSAFQRGLYNIAHGGLPTWASVLMMYVALTGSNYQVAVVLRHSVKNAGDGRDVLSGRHVLKWMDGKGHEIAGVPMMTSFGTESIASVLGHNRVNR